LPFKDQKTKPAVKELENAHNTYLKQRILLLIKYEIVKTYIMDLHFVNKQ